MLLDDAGVNVGRSDELPSLHPPPSAVLRSGTEAFKPEPLNVCLRLPSPFLLCCGWLRP